MKSCKPVPVAKGAFIFCRYSLAVLLWVALILHSEALVIATAVILALSAILTVGRAPMILLYTHTVERLFPSATEVLDQHAMRFAHTLGTVLLLIPLVLFHTPFARAGWGFLIFVTIMKTIGALGFCAAGKMYTCMSNSNSTCCGFLKRSHD